MSASHVVEVRRGVAVCLTCGQVSTSREALVHVANTFLGRAS